MAEDHSRSGRRRRSIAPILFVLLLALLLSAGSIYAIVHHRVTSAFEIPETYQGTFLNREFFADYSRDPEGNTLVAVALDEVSGGFNVSLISVDPGLRPLSEEIIAVALRDH